MKTLVKISIKLAALAIVASASSPVTAYTSQAFIKRTAEFAEVANWAYCHQTQNEITIGDVKFQRDADWSTDVVDGYRAVVGSTHHVLINFCGTRTDVGWGIGDVIRDVQGAVVSTPAQNAWLSSSNGKGVGLGFQKRAFNYMKSQSSNKAGRLQEYLDLRAGMVGGKTVIHTVGHSLGGAASQLVSYYLSEYMGEEGFLPNKFKIYNFAYNSPQSVGAGFQAAFHAEVDRGYLTPYSFLVKRDPISTWATSYMHPIATGDQVAEFAPQVDAPAQVDNHKLNDERIQQLGTLTAWQASTAANMASKYLPGCKL
ncbi:MAG: hypothetical protein K0V04_33720 [Deltaproteobacteria bacterium]|nr:hypothetical protein [Deltaproteobacteria bacterium]